MAGEKDATVQVEDEGLITVELPAGLTVDEDDNGEPVSLQDLHEAVTPKPTGEPKTPKETVQRQPRRTAVDEAAEALSAAQATGERERKLRLAAEQNAQSERNRADEAIRIANERGEEAKQALERATNSEMTAVTTAIETSKSELAAAKQAFVVAHEAGDAMKMADAQEKIGDATASIRLNTSKKAELETAAARSPKTGHEGRVEAPRPSGTPLERYIAPMAPRAQSWLRAHPDYIPSNMGGDPVKNSKMMAGHYAALAENITEGSDEYFQKIEEHIGERDAPVSAAAVTKKAGETDTAPAQRPAPRQRQAQPSAPPSRDAPGPDGGAPVSRTVRLTPEQQEAALFSFPQNRGEADDAWKKRALGTYAREYIQAKAEGKIGRMTH